MTCLLRTISAARGRDSETTHTTHETAREGTENMATTKESFEIDLIDRYSIIDHYPRLDVEDFDEIETIREYGFKHGGIIFGSDSRFDLMRLAEAMEVEKSLVSEARRGDIALLMQDGCTYFDADEHVSF